MTDPYCDCGAPYPTHVFCETCWEKREAEIEDLEATVAKLPKTADGVPVVPGMEVYTAQPSPQVTNVIKVEVCGIIEVGTGFNRDEYKRTEADRCYSTREAAEAAKETT